MAIEELSHDVRVIALREAIDQFRTAVNIIRVATHRLIDADLVGSLDVATNVLYQANRAQDLLEGHYRDLVSIDSGNAALIPLKTMNSRRARRRGIDVIPGRVRQARLDAGLSLGQVARGDISRAAISMIEHGKTRPSTLTLQLIATRTGKPMDYFIGAPA